MAMCWIDRNDNEQMWREMWAALDHWSLERFGESVRDTVHPVSGEDWQYMGSARVDAKSAYMHTFRHRMHPMLGSQRVYARVSQHPDNPTRNNVTRYKIVGPGKTAWSEFTTNYYHEAQPA